MKYKHNEIIQYNNSKFVAIDVCDRQHLDGICTGCTFDNKDAHGYTSCCIKEDEREIFGKCYKDGISMIFMSEH